ncbi:preprotein translocase subunit YajC [Lacticaseibacillus rhamnosus MTCC 5462]|nr:preprotein translocase subunit YajC [Lacticaseibacillus rhamnosus MTCC 5462]
MHANLKLGDQIVLIDGIVGTIRGLDQENVRVEIAVNTIINVKRMGSCWRDKGGQNGWRK